MKSKDKISIKKKLLIILSVIVIIIAIVTLGSLYYIKTTFSKVEQVTINENQLAVNKDLDEKFGDIKNIALFGIDAPDGKAGRSDAIMVLTLDSKHNKMKVTSIMRDSYVPIDGHGKDKINHAYAFGGPELAIKTLNENFDLNIKDFIAVNFTSLPEIIDKLGGVDIDITAEEVPHVPGSHVGMNNLNGKQALAYSRIRYAAGGDYKRTERQRVVLDKVFNKLKATPVSQYPSLINTFLPYVKTNMNPNEILGLTKDFASTISGGLQQDRFPKDDQGNGELINGIYYLVFNNDAVKASIYDYIFEDISK